MRALDLFNKQLSIQLAGYKFEFPVVSSEDSIESGPLCSKRTIGEPEIHEKFAPGSELVPQARLLQFLPNRGAHGFKHSLLH